MEGPEPRKTLFLNGRAESGEKDQNGGRFSKGDLLLIPPKDSQDRERGILREALNPRSEEEEPGSGLLGEGSRKPSRSLEIP